MEKRDFRLDYWPQKLTKLKLDPDELFDYEHMNYGLKEVKNLVGFDVRTEVQNQQNQIIDVSPESNLGKNRFKELYRKANAVLDKQYKFYSEKNHTVLRNQIINLIREIKNDNTHWTFMDHAFKLVEQVDDYLDFTEIHLYSVTHLFKKLDNSIKVLNREVLSGFLKQEAKENNSFVHLARSWESRVNLEGLKLVEVYIYRHADDILRELKDLEHKATFLERCKKLKVAIEEGIKKHTLHVDRWLREFKEFNQLRYHDKIEVDEEREMKKAIAAAWDDELANFKTVDGHTFKTHSLEVPGTFASSSKESHSYSDLSAWLVLVHTMYYMLMYYGNSPTASKYSDALDFSSSLSGIVQAATPLAAFLSTFHYRAIIGPQGYTKAYILSLICLVSGSFFYYIAKSFDSLGIPTLILGRVLIGYGGGRVITRNFVATIIKPKYRNLWSAYLVAFTALSITVGPGISSILSSIGDQDYYGTEIREYTVFAWVFTMVGIIFIIVFFTFYTDIPSSRKKKASRKINKPIEMRETGKNKSNSSGESQDFEDVEGNKIESFAYSSFDDINSEPNIIITEPIRTQKVFHDPTFQGLDVLKKTTLVKQYFPLYFLSIFFTINKMIQEAVITEAPQTMKELYGWTPKDVGYMLLSFTPVTLTLSLLPAYLGQSRGLKNIKMMIFFSICTFIGFFLKVNYLYNEAEEQWIYILATCFILAFSLATEVTMTAMFAEITPPYIQVTYWNAGLFSGLGDTFGRALGNTDVTIFTAFDGVEALTFWMYLILAPIYLIFIIITILKASKLKYIPRVKAEITVPETCEVTSVN